MSGFENQCVLSDYADCIPIRPRGSFLYIGGFRSAVCSWKILQEAGITHIVNCTTKVDNAFERYFEYCNIPVPDTPTANLLSYFDTTSDFIERAEGNVLVHCMAGQSRSVAIVIAYLIRYRHYSRNDAIRFLQCHRTSIRPNRGFLRQLSIYEYHCSRKQQQHRQLSNTYYTIEWAREAMKFQETFGLPDVDAQYAHQILPVVLHVAALHETPERSTAWLEAVWKTLKLSLVVDEASSLRYLEHHHHGLRPSIRTSKSF